MAIRKQAQRGSGVPRPKNAYDSTGPRVKFRKLVMATATHCGICGKPFDPNARPNTPGYPTVDHIVPLSLGGAPFDLANVRPAHHGCNSGRSNDMRRVNAAASGWTSRAW
jgi:5-methylcytosine-specific restriction endonuclease McrA